MPCTVQHLHVTCALAHFSMSVSHAQDHEELMESKPLRLLFMDPLLLIPSHSKLPFRVFLCTIVRPWAMREQNTEGS